MAKNTIKLKKYSDNQQEHVASAAITPGMLLEFDSNNKVKPHATAGANAQPIFALEDELQGNGINDAYASGDPVQVWFPAPGDEVYAIVKDDTVAITKGDYLESAGGGYVQKHSADTETLGADSSGNLASIYSQQIVLQAMESVNLSGSSGAESSGPLGYNKRIKARVV
jgi:hypothetical protein